MTTTGTVHATELLGRYFFQKKETVPKFFQHLRTCACVIHNRWAQKCILQRRELQWVEYTLSNASVEYVCKKIRVENKGLANVCTRLRIQDFVFQVV